MTKKRQGGFTLIELLVVIGILAVLMAIVLVAINPARQFAQANNTKRSSDVNAILNAIHQYAADHRGNLGTLISATAPNIDSTNYGALCAALVPTYIAQLPVDPGTNDGAPVAADCSGTWDTAYEVVQSATDNRITVSAPDTDLTVMPAGSTVISVTR